MFSVFRCLKLYIPLFDSDTYISSDHMFQHWHPEPLRNVFPKKRAATPFVFVQQIGKFPTLSRWFKSWSFLSMLEVTFSTWVNGSPWVNGSLNSPSQKGHGLKHLGETHCWNLISWIFFLRRPRESVAQFWTHARCRHTEPHRAAATPVQTQLEARGESHRVSQRLEIRKRRQVKPWILFGSFFLRLSKLNYFLNKKVCGEVDGMPMTSMTIQLGSRICLWNGQLYAPSKGTSLMLNMCI